MPRLKEALPAPRNPKEAIELFEEHRKLPAAFLFSTPGDLAHVIEIRDRSSKVKEIQLRLGTPQPGYCLSVSLKRYGGKSNALAVLRWVAQRCGLVIRNLDGGSHKGSIRGTRPRSAASGVAGIHFKWIDSGASTVLHVVASIPATTEMYRTPTARQWSTEKWGRRGALEEAVKARLAIGAVQPDFDLLLARLEAFYEAGPTRVDYAARSRTRIPAEAKTLSMAA